MSKKRYVEEFDDLDDSVFDMLGNQYSKIAESRDRLRERHAADGQDVRQASHKHKRGRARPQ
ncbi:MAG: hypothetical protein ACREQZ_12510 [Woeseiaceae bacterium]